MENRKIQTETSWRVPGLPTLYFRINFSGKKHSNLMAPLWRQRSARISRLRQLARAKNKHPGTAEQRALCMNPVIDKQDWLGWKLPGLGSFRFQMFLGCAQITSICFSNFQHMEWLICEKQGILPKKCTEIRWSHGGTEMGQILWEQTAKLSVLPCTNLQVTWRLTAILDAKQRLSKELHSIELHCHYSSQVCADFLQKMAGLFIYLPLLRHTVLSMMMKEEFLSIKQCKRLLKWVDFSHCSHHWSLLSLYT